MASFVKNGVRCYGHLVFPGLSSARVLPTTSSLRQQQGEGLTVVIPTAGQGKRMKSYGPKALIELRQGETVLSRQLTILRKRFPLADFVVVTGFESDKICRHLPFLVRVVENQMHEETNVARSLDLGLKACVDERVLLVYGDLVFNSKTFEDMPQGESWALVDRPVNGQTQLNSLEVGITVIDNQVTRFAYGLDAKWGQVAFLEGSELQTFRRLAADRDRHRCFGFELLNAVLDKGGRLAAHSPAGMKLVEIDCSKDIELAQRIR
jgi:choline kinase